MPSPETVKHPDAGWTDVILGQACWQTSELARYKELWRGSQVG